MSSHHQSGAVARARSLRRRATLAERLLWPELRKLKLNISRQAPIGRFIADFVCHGPRLVIEIDGAAHDNPDAQIRDLERTAWLESQGYCVIRLNSEAVLADPAGAANQIRVTVAPPKGLITFPHDVMNAVMASASIPSPLFFAGMEE